MTKLEAIRRLEEEVRQYKEDLRDIDSGRTQFGQRPAGAAEWIDTTQDEAAWLRGVIKSHEGVIAALKEGRI